MPPQGALNIGVPFAALDLFRFTKGEGHKDHKPEEEAGVHRILHLIELDLHAEGLIGKRTRTVHAAATDGHRLAHYTWELVSGEQFLGGPFYLDSRAVRQYLAQYPTERQYELDYQLMKVGRQIFLKSDAGEAMVGGTEKLEYKYPDYPAILPKTPIEGAIAHPVSLDGGYLEDFVRYKKNQNALYRARRKMDPTIPWDGPRELGLVIHYREPLKAEKDEGKTALPARITYEHGLLVGKVEFLLMPRSSNPNELRQL
jgi:hypothetical protein